MKKLAWIAAAILVASSAVSAQQVQKEEALRAAGIESWEPGQGKTSPAFSKLETPIELPGDGTGATVTIQYDSGVITALPAAFGQVFGNRFEVDNNGNPFKTTITLNSFSFLFAAPDTGKPALFIIPAEPINASMIGLRASVFVSGLANAGLSFSGTTFNVVQQTVLGTAGTFPGTLYLGYWNGNAATTVPVDGAAMGLDTATFNGGHQGFTASSGGTEGTPVSVAFTPQAFNAVLRANLTGIVPVELMSFEVE